MPDPQYKILPRPQGVKPQPGKDRYSWFEEQVRAIGPGHEFQLARANNSRGKAQ